MSEIYKDTSEWVYLNVYQDGVAADADATPTVTVTDGDGTDLGVHPVSATATGVYRTLVTLVDTDVEKIIYVDWSFNMSGLLVEKRDTFNVVTPYIDIQSVRDKYMDIKGYTDWTALTAAQQQDVEDQARYAEQYARFMINAVTSDSFGMARRNVVAYGQQSDVLAFTDRLLTIEKIWINNNLEYDNVSDPVVNNLPYNPVITESNYAIRLEPSYDIQEYEVINPVYKFGYFKQGYRYNVQAVVGYNGVPTEIEMAARELVNDYFCKDTAWQQKYVSSIASSDWKMTFDRAKYRGTGNFTVDRILSDFTYIRFSVI